MKKTILILALLTLLISSSLARTVQISMGEYPMRDICEQLQQISFTFEGDTFEGTEYENLTEFPPEMIDFINEKIQGEEQAVEALSTVDGMTFSVEILYNESECFSGSFMFNDSELQFLKLEPDELAGTDSEHIYAHVELITIEELIMEWQALEAGELNPIQVIGLFMRTIWTITTTIIGGDIYIEPMSALLRIGQGINIVVNLPSFEGLGEHLRSALI